MEGRQADLQRCARLLKAAGSDEARQQLLKGFEAAFQGRVIPRLPEALVNEIAKAGGGSLALRLRQRDASAIDEALRVIRDEETKLPERLELVRICAELRVEKLPEVIFQLIDSSSSSGEARQELLGALQNFPQERVSQWIVRKFGILSSEEQKVAQSVLAARVESARLLFDGVEEEEIDPLAITVETLRKCLLFEDQKINELVSDRWGNVAGATTADMKAQVARITSMLNERSGDVYKGQKLFRENCGKCHKLFIDGGEIGPDLTAYQRSDTATMVLNVVNPNAEIREGFENYLVVTDEGLAVTGLMVERDSQIVVLRTAEGQTVTIDRDAIEESRVLGHSLMPEGLLKKLADEEIANLFAYLRSTQPLNN